MYRLFLFIQKEAFEKEAFSFVLNEQTFYMTKQALVWELSTQIISLEESRPFQKKRSFFSTHSFLEIEMSNDPGLYLKTPFTIKNGYRHFSESFKNYLQEVSDWRELFVSDKNALASL